jgi:hypothetical protein
MSGHNKKKLMGPILFSYYEESLVSPNLNSKLLWFHSARPKGRNHAPMYVSRLQLNFQIR